MIQVEAIRIRELRGIRELQLTPQRKNFVISGPNGSGKSGVVDAIQFGLTGEISRLSGKGTGGLSVQKHGPHVDRRNDPAVAEVSLTLYFPERGKTAVLTRNVKTAKTFKLAPEDAGVRALVEEVARHPELTLSRREIIKYILVEASERSKEIQALLKLEVIGNARSVLATAKNRVTRAHSVTQADTANAKDALRRHLDVKELSSDDVLAAVNQRRHVLGLPAITELKVATVLNAGAAEGEQPPAFNKKTALKDLEAMKDAQAGFPALGGTATKAILADLTTLEGDRTLLDAVKQQSFVERGLALMDGPHCPLCDMEWEDEEHLKNHLKTKLAKSEQAAALQKRVLENANVIVSQARRIVALSRAVQPVAEKDGTAEFSRKLSVWTEQLTAFAESLGTVDEVLSHKARFEQSWIAPPPTLAATLETLASVVKAKPDQSAAVAAHSFLTLAQDRFATYLQNRRAEKRAQEARRIGQIVYATYCSVAEERLTALYDAVEGDFSDFYREINSDDEEGFNAKFAPAEGKLDLEVAFYDKGMYPPGAYHSEGHQDGMGVCLYLALMKRLLGDRFRFAVFDDVVMSVDQDHRKQFCRLLKSRFSETQFIITTHDKIWAKQMQTEGLVEPKSGVVFHSWNVQAGPIFEQIAEVWDQIEADLTRNAVETAASRLRRHLEYIAGELAEKLGAKPVYRGDFSYDLGDLLPVVIGRHGELLGMAAKAANAWRDDDAKAKVEAMKTARTKALTKYNGEQWIINKAIHYNEWASFTKNEFRVVVDAFKALLLQFRCAKPSCESWLYITPRKGTPEVLRCRCMKINLNLNAK